MAHQRKPSDYERTSPFLSLYALSHAVTSRVMDFPSV
jgi:hypothetical protein